MSACRLEEVRFLQVCTCEFTVCHVPPRAVL